MKKRAYVFINVSAGKLDMVLRTLSGMPQVISAEGVSGHCDVIAVVGAGNLESLQDTILSTIRGVDGIQSTETVIVMVPQPDTWTPDELDNYIDGCNKDELTVIKVLAEKGRGMMIQELIDSVAEELGDDEYDIHSLTVTLALMTRRADSEYRRENLVAFDEDMGYFLNEQYLDLIGASLTR
ncbi:MAG: Lrp/AsnC ligand binding domain-containing protein [Actinobacteria bacterium]|nr:Lrp/AsnC ligand binding domain-containing protein [Actinomycetota bacterium]